MHKLGDQWIEMIDGQEHMVKAVKTTVHPPCGLCVYGHGYQCMYPSALGECDKYAIKDLGILHAGLLPCPFCGEYPKVSSYGFRGEPKEYGIFHLCKDSYSKIETQHYATTQQAIDAWNRRE